MDHRGTSFEKSQASKDFLHLFPSPPSGLYQQAAEHHATLMTLMRLVLTAMKDIPATTFGATIPGLLQDEGQVAEDSGLLPFIPALANSLGFLMMAFLLHHYLDFGMQLLVVAGLSLAAWLVHERRRLASLAAGMGNVYAAAIFERPCLFCSELVRFALIAEIPG